MNICTITFISAAQRHQKLFTSLNQRWEVIVDLILALLLFCSVCGFILLSFISIQAFTCIYPSVNCDNSAPLGALIWFNLIPNCCHRISPQTLNDEATWTLQTSTDLFFPLFQPPITASPANTLIRILNNPSAIKVEHESCIKGQERWKVHQAVCSSEQTEWRKH